MKLIAQSDLLQLSSCLRKHEASMQYDEQKGTAVMKILQPNFSQQENIEIEKAFFVFYTCRHRIPYYSKYQIVFKKITHFEYKEDYEYSINELFSLMKGTTIESIKYDKDSGQITVNFLPPTPSDTIKLIMKCSNLEIEIVKNEPELIYWKEPLNTCFSIRNPETEYSKENRIRKIDKMLDEFMNKNS